MSTKETENDSVITSFISQNPRNELIIVKNGFSGIEFLNMDVTLSNAFVGIIGERHFSLKAKDIIHDTMRKEHKSHEAWGEYIGLSNLGILLEKELRFDFKSFLNDHSQNQVLFLKWAGETEPGKLYFLTKKHGLEIDISNLSHIVL